jgi:hypothetical protein
MDAGARSILIAAAVCGATLGLTQCGLTERNKLQEEPTEPVATLPPDAGEPDAAPLDAGTPDAMAPRPPDPVMVPIPVEVPPVNVCPPPLVGPRPPVSVRRFAVQWDYRFDSHGFMADGPRTLLDQAARIWGEVVRSNFPTVPAGTKILMRNPERPDEAGNLLQLDYDIDDLAVFVASAKNDGPGGAAVAVRDIAALGSVDNLELRALLTDRYTGAKFQPWTAWMTLDPDEAWFFDTTPESADDLPPEQLDFLSVAVSALGQALGMGGSDAFRRLLDADGSFRGCAAMAAFGGPVPLNANHTHVQRDVISDGRRPVLSVVNLPGERNAQPTPLDLAILADLGYDVVTE